MLRFIRVACGVIKRMTNHRTHRLARFTLRDMLLFVTVLCVLIALREPIARAANASYEVAMWACGYEHLIYERKPTPEGRERFQRARELQRKREKERQKRAGNP